MKTDGKPLARRAIELPKTLGSPFKNTTNPVGKEVNKELINKLNKIRQNNPNKKYI
jgi:hypothetical protein